MHVHHSWKVFLSGGKPTEARHDGRLSLKMPDGIKNVSERYPPLPIHGQPFVPRSAPEQGHTLTTLP